MVPKPSSLKARPQPTRLFLAGGGLLCTLAMLVLLLQPQPELLSLHRQLAACSAVAALAFFWFSRQATPVSMPDSVLMAALMGIALVVALAWQLGTGLRTIVLGIVPLLVGLSLLLAWGWRAVLVGMAGVSGIALLAWRDHAAGPESAASALSRLTLSSGVWAHVVMLLGGVVFGVVARMLVQRWRQLADEREQQFRELLASAADRYIELDADLRFAHPSVDLPSPAGPVPASFIGRHPWDAPGLVFDPGEARSHQQDLLARRAFTIEVESRVDARRPPQRLAISGRPRYSSEGRFLGYWCAGRDISAQQQQRQATSRAVAEAESASLAKSRFLANMSHEVRTPLNGILGLARLARQHVDERERLVGYLDLISNSATALHTTLSDVLDLSRAEASQLKLSLHRVDLPALLGELHRVHEALCQARGLQCTLSLDAGLPQHVRTDGGRLRQILNNYLHNALKFTTQGGIALNVQALGDGRWRFAVQDSGPGIAADHLPRLFVPFSQVDDSAQRAHGGSGLGLSICRQLALAMGGEVGVSSEPGRGSRFWVDLPLVPDTSPTGLQAAPATAEPSLAGMRALVVEDNPVNMLITVALLEDWGVDVQQAADGRAAMGRIADEFAAGRHFDVVLMDLQMPGIDGMATTRALRAAGVQTPVVAVTATVFDDARAQTLAADFVDVLSKPIDAPLLKALLAGLRRGAGAS